MSEAYDCVVIGAGISGLMSAAMLSQKGYKVTVVERDIHPGGCAASFNKEGYRFAVGATVAMGLEPNGLVDSLYTKLGLKADFVEANPAIRVHLDDRKVNVETSHDAWFKELKRAFPGQEEEKLRFWKEVASIASTMHYVSKRFPVMPFRHPRDLLDTAKAAHPSLISIIPKLWQTVQDRLDHYGIRDDTHKAFIDGQLLDAMQVGSQHCVSTSGALALGIYRYGCQYKKGGLSSIADDLVSYIKSTGNTVQYATRVKEIYTAEGKTQGVRTNRGDYDASVVVSAIPMSNTANLVSAWSRKLEERATKQAEMWGAFTLYMGVDESVLGDTPYFYEQVTSTSILKDSHEEASNLLISISPSWDESRAPAGKRAITVSTHVNAERWMQIAQERGAYEQAKRQMEARLMTQIERVFPSIKEGVEVFMSGTPKTFKNFTLRDGGTVGGFPQTLKHANFAAPSHRTDIQGLFLAGDTVFPGQGLLGASVSGYNSARSASRFLVRNAKQSNFIQRPKSYSKEINI